jgi:Xaa-Pro aminopeptidase
MRGLRAGVVLTVLILGGAPGTGARAAAAQVAPGEYAARRQALVAGIDSGVVIALGGVEPVNYWPTFYQLPSFHYLTGFGESDGALVMVKRRAGLDASLFVPYRDPIRERWLGERIRIADLENKVGIRGRDAADLGAVLDSLASSGLPFYLVTDDETTDFADADSLTRGKHLVAQLRQKHPSLAVQSLDSTVRRMRARKSPAEIALLRKATEISVVAHKEAMKATAPGCGENEIQALLEGTFRRLGADRPGYGSIVGSGPNATILHYMRDDRVMQDGELLLIDAAAAFDHYSSDVTRTLPVNGKFSRAQRDVYQIVLDAQDAFVRQIRAGGELRAANDSGAAVVAAGLVRLGLIESADATFDPPTGMRCPPAGCLQSALYALHGYGGHGIGTEVHDPAQYYEEGNRFGVGDVFTVEPGLYVSPELIASLPDTPANRKMLAKTRPAIERYKGIGVRIEDDYAVTEGGVEWLSKGAPRQMAEIEALMRQPAPALPGGGTCGRPST